MRERAVAALARGSGALRSVTTGWIAVDAELDRLAHRVVHRVVGGDCLRERHRRAAIRARSDRSDSMRTRASSRLARASSVAAYSPPVPSNKRQRVAGAEPHDAYRVMRDVADGNGIVQPTELRRERERHEKARAPARLMPRATTKIEMVFVGSPDEADPRVDRVRRRVRDVGRQEQPALAAREQLARERRDERRRVAASARARAACTTGAIRAKVRRRVVESRVTPTDRRRPRSGKSPRRDALRHRARGCAPAESGMPTSAMNAICAVDEPRRCRRRRDTRRAGRAGHVVATAVSACWRKRTRSSCARPVSSRPAPRERLACGRARRSRPAAPASRGARSSANAHGRRGDRSAPMSSGPSSRWIAAPSARRRRRSRDTTRVAGARRRPLQRMRGSGEGCSADASRATRPSSAARVR